MTDHVGDYHAPALKRQHRFRVLAVIISLALVSVGLAGPTAIAQSTLRVTVGVGDSVTFSIGSDEPHTITFGAGPADIPPPFWPASGFDAPDESAPPPYDLGTVATDGTDFVNTGVLFGKGSSATFEFTAPGSYPFCCAFHPGMAGQVTVVQGGPTTTQAAADTAGRETVDALLGQIGPLQQARLDSAGVVDNDDGAQTWNVFVDAATEVAAMAGGGSGYLELLQFTPAAIRIEPGDTISWTASKIHTVTFVPEGIDPGGLFPSEEAVFAPMGGSTYDGTEPVNSGIFNFALDPAVPALTEFSLTFPEPGVYPFFCALHADLGQVGVVAVGVDLPDISA